MIKVEGIANGVLNFSDLPQFRDGIFERVTNEVTADLTRSIRLP